MKIETAIYDPALFEKWKKKLLQKKWQKRYKNIFDKDDLRIALTQPRYHFGEWFAAICYAKQGYKVLVEKYIYPLRQRKSQQRKFGIMKKRWPDVLDYLWYFRREHHCQPPDLFVYKGKEFLFVEVKLNRDKLSKSQKSCFLKLERELNCKVRVFCLRPKI